MGPFQTFSVTLPENRKTMRQTPNYDAGVCAAPDFEFRPMRRKNQQLTDEECAGILGRATAGTLALLGDGGYPYSLPISYVYSDGRLLFHSALKGHKIDAIRQCGKASFSIIDKDEVRPKEYTTYFRSVICFGRIRIIEDEEEKLQAARLLGNRYNPNDDDALRREFDKAYKAMCMIELRIEHMTGKEAKELVRMKART